ncbi:MAG: GIN domain-containing protein, partial [Vitreimonas sp.]
MRLFLAATAASLCALAGQAGAQTFAATAVRVENAAAVVTVIPEDRADIHVAIAPGARLATPTARVSGEGVVIDGGLGGNRIRGCMSTTRTVVRIAGIGNVAREDLPRITIRTPRRLDLSIGGAVHTTVGASAGGSAAFNGCGDATMAAASGPLDVDLNGSGDIEVARVGGVLAATLNGSGSLNVARADGDAALRLNGSGDLEVGDVRGRLDARLTGSGSLEVGSAGGDTRLALNGSGDVEAGAVAGSLDAELRGSGSVSVASVVGP